MAYSHWFTGLNTVTQLRQEIIDNTLSLGYYMQRKIKSYEHWNTNIISITLIQKIAMVRKYIIKYKEDLFGNELLWMTLNWQIVQWKTSISIAVGYVNGGQPNNFGTKHTNTKWYFYHLTLKDT